MARVQKVKMPSEREAVCKERRLGTLTPLGDSFVKVQGSLMVYDIRPSLIFLEGNAN